MSVVVVLGLTLGLTELYARRLVPANLVWKIPPIYQPDPDLGYAGVPNASGEELYKVGNEVLSQAFLQLDNNGFRTMSQVRPKNAEKCVVLLGDSNTFGIGIDIDHTLANQLQKKFSSKAAVFNFGFTGYGPHQVLRFFEIEREKSLLQGCRSYHFALLAMEDHIWRVTGRAPWGLSAPKYHLENGHAVYSGPYFPEWVNKINTDVQKFSMTRFIVGFLLGYEKPPGVQDWQLYDSVLTGIQDIVRTRYHSPLSIIYILKGRPSNLAQFAALKNPKLNVEFFEDLAPDRQSTANLLHEYYLPDEIHLNNKGHEFLANLIFRRANNLWNRKYFGQRGDL